MKKSLMWKVLCLLGMCPFIVPVLMSGTRMGSWSFMDWMIMWSYVYWPTYIIGLAVIFFSVYKLRKLRR